MSNIIEQVRIKSATDTAAAWTAANKVLLAGEWGLEIDTGYTKIGDGATAWTLLPYYKPDTKKSYDSGWLAVTTWTGGATITITHNMGLSFENYHKSLLIRDPSNPGVAYNAEFIFFNGTMYGQHFNRSVDVNTVEIQIGQTAMHYLPTSGIQAFIPATWEYKVNLKEL